MSSVVIAGNTSGSVTLAAPDVAGTTTLTLPATSGTVLTSASPASILPSSINGPAFSVYSSGSQSVSATTYTKILLQNEEYDTNNNFASSRFTPTVAGYYQINWAISAGGFNSSYFFATIYKNGASYKFGNNFPTSSGGGPTSAGSTLIYFNGSTDYIEMYALSSAAFTTNAAADNTWMNGVLVRSA